MVLDGSDLRKPYAENMGHLQRVKRLAGEDSVNGYRTLNAIGLAPDGKRGLLYHHLFSSAAPGLRQRTGRDARRAPVGGDRAGAAGGRGRHGDRHPRQRLRRRGGLGRGLGVELAPRLPPQAPRPLDGATGRRPLPSPGSGAAAAAGGPRGSGDGRAQGGAAPPEAAAGGGDGLVRAAGGELAAGRRTTEEEADQATRCGLVEVRLEKVAAEPWWLLTDHPVETAEQALRIFRMVLPTRGDRGRL